MMTMRWSRAVPAAVLLSLLGLATAGCGGCDDCDGIVVGGGPGPTMVPDFMLEDVNPNSTTHQVLISPRRFTGEISAWYFGYAT